MRMANGCFLEASELGFGEGASHRPGFSTSRRLNCRDEIGDTPLILAAGSGNHELVQFC